MNENNQFPVLSEGTVKNWKEKVANVGRPTIFVGSSMESKVIAEKIKSCFPKEEFELDIWYDGVFGKTKSTGGELSNMEWLKNFTDIYDYAIFIFVPDDEIVSLSRFDQENNNARKANAARHNVVFEFGMFMGRIGAKKTYILYDNDTDAFVKLFFTDLIENLNDTKMEINDQFRIELFNYKGHYRNYINSKFKELPYDNDSIEQAIGGIKNQIIKNFNDVEINFLPATSLAFGYFNNLVGIFAESMYCMKNGLPLPDAWVKYTAEELQSVNDEIAKHDSVELRIVLPTSISWARQEAFNPDFKNSELFGKFSFPGKNRMMPCSCLKKSVDRKLILYDVPTTLTSSVEAIQWLTPYQDIRELLMEKELRNFKKALQKKLDSYENEFPNHGIRSVVKLISREEFLAETKRA